MRHITSALCLLLSLAAAAAGPGPARHKAEGDSAYARQDYQAAVGHYLLAAKSAASPEVCYNLGCVYYRLDDMARSVLWLERASLLDPGDSDIRFNLEMARSKTIDKITPRHEFILVTAFHRLAAVMNLREWAAACAALFGLALLSLALYFFSGRMALRKTGFALSALLLLLCALGNVCAYRQRARARSRSGGVVMAPAVTVKSTPADSGNDLFVLHEGTRVSILDESLKDWCEVEIADGKLGWMPKKAFEVI